MHKYLRDASVGFPSPVSESESESDVSSISSISSISSVSSVSSLSSVDTDISQGTLVPLSHSDLMALHHSIVKADVDESPIKCKRTSTSFTTKISPLGSCREILKSIMPRIMAPRLLPLRLRPSPLKSLSILPWTLLATAYQQRHHLFQHLSRSPSGPRLLMTRSLS